MASPRSFGLPRRYATYTPTSTGTGWIVAGVALGLWLVVVAFGSQVLAWGIDQILITLSQSLPRVWWAILTTVGVVLMLPGAVLFGYSTRAGQVLKVTGRQWTFAAVCLFTLGFVRAVVPVAQNEFTLWLTAMLAAALALLLRRLGSPDFPVPSGAPRSTAALAAAVGAVAVLTPWFVFAALGGLAETIAAVAAAAALGWLVTVLVEPVWLTTMAAGRTRIQTVGVGGLVITVTLAVVAAGVGGSGVQLIALFAVPPLGFALTGLARWAGRSYRWPVGILAAGGFAGPLAFVDPEETSLVLNLSDSGLSREALYWTLVAVLWTAVAALVVAAGYVALLAARKLSGRARTAAVTGPLVLVLAASAGLYATEGHPGFFGERWFVVLDSQADLVGLAGISDRHDRASQTYQRLVHFADTAQAPLRKALQAKNLGYTPYYLVNAIEVHSGSAAVREWLNRQPHVAKVLESPRLRPLPAPVEPMTGDRGAPTQTPWNLTMIGADRAWFSYGVTGSGIVIGSSDSGVDGDQPVLKSSYRGNDGRGDSWYDPWNHTTFPTDLNGHGTHTIASAVGRTVNGLTPTADRDTGAIRNAGVTGVAPGAQWMACVNLARNLGNPARYLDCLQYMLAPFADGADPLHAGDPTRGADILTNSWGCPSLEGCDRTVLDPAVAALTAAGIFVVVAAGNTGPACDTIEDAPSTDKEAFTVGAVNKLKRMADFSSRGATGTASDGKPDIAAPGVEVLSALPGNQFGVLSGTSMATPHVAGVVALMWSANPRLVGDIERTKQILRDTATPATLTAQDVKGCGGSRNLVGAGIVNAGAAVEASLSLG
jgi:subtilisin family serine protease